MHIPDAIGLAALDGNEAVVASWLDDGGPIDATWPAPDDDHVSGTLLMAAINCGRERIVEMLLQRGE